ncbi:hypothetical protein D9599_16520 [Roseomonas sp. KE2513]|uniref:type II toxin-antitoxin system ParD family antitoxin n=1 Tax=Roseomonas sp. KE2513 TaxID=2479202 RepID=UPI0018DF2326|nr:type II toxin-antitoxin system ParD family antitoxin [Roseomonas sp. KE2513]MBI0537176.1 hypothetical protein [Roseomonas sp. KE2513]
MPNRKTRNVLLTPEFDSYADACVASGRRGASKVARAALRLMERSGSEGSSQKPESVGEQASARAR